MSKKISQEKLVKKALSNPKVKKEYNSLEAEFNLLNEMIKARKKSGKTQEDVAKKMHTSTSVIGRLEGLLGSNNKPSPTLSTLQRYADAIDCDLKIKIVPKKHHDTDSV